MTDLLASRRVLLGAVALFLVLSLAYISSIGIRASRGSSIAGDEPFYLLTTQSLLQDRDLDLRNQYEARSYESFFDHPHGLWRQSVPAHDGRLLSPHNPGLSVVVIPGFALGGLVGAQVQLMLMAAGTMALAFLLAYRITARYGICWLAALAVGLTATALIYSTEVYPEFPAAMALVISLLLVTGRQRLTLRDAPMIVIALTAMCWLGVKYAPLAFIISAYALFRADTQFRAALLGLGGVSAALFWWSHVETFGSVTPYGVSTVFYNWSTAGILEQHLGLGDRVYRLWGLFIDRRFGIGRWAPVLLVVIPGLVLLARSNGPHRLVLALIVTQMLIATFLAITMMGWWFAGRTLMTVLPLFVIPLALAASRSPTWCKGLMVALGVYSVSITAALAWAGHTGEVVIAVAPFDMGYPLFRGVAHLFPNYTSWTWETWGLTVCWLALAVASAAAAAWPIKGLFRRAPSSRGRRKSLAVAEHQPACK